MISEAYVSHIIGVPVPESLPKARCRVVERSQYVVVKDQRPGPWRPSITREVQQLGAKGRAKPRNMLVSPEGSPARPGAASPGSPNDLDDSDPGDGRCPHFPLMRPAHPGPEPPSHHGQEQLHWLALSEAKDELSSEAPLLTDFGLKLIEQGGVIAERLVPEPPRRPVGSLCCDILRAVIADESRHWRG